jgi:hypothetical protein
MEHDSLEALKSLIEEEIYLIPEDREKILAELETSTKESQTEIITKDSPLPPAAEDKKIVSTVQAAQPEVTSEVIKDEALVESITVIGNFSRGVLILHEEAALRDELMEMLVKMINACGHSMSEIGLVASEHLEGRSMEDFNNLNAHTVLKFGRVSHPINSVPAKPYEVYSERETEFLFADSLSMIAEDVNLKKKLWTSLQVLFKLK